MGYLGTFPWHLRYITQHNVPSSIMRLAGYPAQLNNKLIVWFNYNWHVMKLTTKKIWTTKSLSRYECACPLMEMVTEIFIVIYGLKIGSISLTSVIELLNGVLFLLPIDEESEIRKVEYWAQGHTLKCKSWRTNLFFWWKTCVWIISWERYWNIYICTCIYMPIIDIDFYRIY